MAPPTTGVRSILRDDLRSSSSLAAAAVAAFVAAIAFGRLTGDRLLARFGPVLVYRTATLVAGVGFAASLALRHPVAGFVGLVLLGLGRSVTLPVAISA